MHYASFNFLETPHRKHYPSDKCFINLWITFVGNMVQYVTSNGEVTQNMSVMKSYVFKTISQSVPKFVQTLHTTLKK